MLSNSNLFLVSVEMPVAAYINDLSGLCLRFHGADSTATSSLSITRCPSTSRAVNKDRLPNPA
ncbi:hypothetical protein CASFOL_006993 [Castilleja foliolosa]|uniref:Uncharacterized protein n=1 Tax=Castilleja foliolosa TaxID=1961234 RepID=A0ABD3EBU2_9LAMI